MSRCSKQLECMDIYSPNHYMYEYFQYSILSLCIKCPNMIFQDMVYIYIFKYQYVYILCLYIEISIRFRFFKKKYILCLYPMFISYVCILIYDNSVLTQKHHSIPVRKAEDLASLRIAEERGTGVVTVYLEVWSQSPRKIKIYIYI